MHTRLLFAETAPPIARRWEVVITGPSRWSGGNLRTLADAAAQAASHAGKADIYYKGQRVLAIDGGIGLNPIYDPSQGLDAAYLDRAIRAPGWDGLPATLATRVQA